MDRHLVAPDLAADDLDVLLDVPVRAVCGRVVPREVRHRHERVVDRRARRTGTPASSSDARPSPAAMGFIRAERIVVARECRSSLEIVQQALGADRRVGHVGRLDVEPVPVEPVAGARRGPGSRPSSAGGRSRDRRTPAGTTPRSASRPRAPRRRTPGRDCRLPIHERERPVEVRGLQVQRADAVRGHRGDGGGRVRPRAVVVQVDPHAQALERPDAGVRARERRRQVPSCPSAAVRSVMTIATAAMGATIRDKIRRRIIPSRVR